MEEKVIKAIIGLGNPGPKHFYQRHNIGFRVLDELAGRHNGVWQTKGESEIASIAIDAHKIVLIKPQTFMNTSGRVIPSLTKQGIKPEQILVIHDELEVPFGTVKYKFGGSHRGHNGLRSIMGVCGADFGRVRCGIGRPVNKDMVPDYVLQSFDASPSEIEHLITEAADMAERLVRGTCIAR